MEDTAIVQENEALIEQMLRDAEKAEEPGDFKEGTVIHKGDDEVPLPMLAMKVQSAGYAWVYDTKTGVPSRINKNMLRSALRKKRPDGSYVFGLKQLVKPVQGIYKCLLHKDDPDRKHYDEMGFAVCPKDNLASPFHVRRHMQKRHKVEWEAIEHEKLEIEKKEDRELQRTLIARATPVEVPREIPPGAPLYVSDKKEVKTRKKRTLKSLKKK